MSKTIFFDLDGTLSDPEVGIVESIRYAFSKLELDFPEGDDLAWVIGPPLLESFTKLVGSELAPKALDVYRERFSEIGWKENVIYPEVVDMLEGLVASGRRLFVATSKPQVFADKIVSHFDLQKYFGRVFGSELDGTRSNKEELLRYAISEVGCASAATMVGDRKYDIAGAKANGLPSIGVTYGYGSKAELRQAGADLLVDAPSELLLALGVKTLSVT